MMGRLLVILVLTLALLAIIFLMLTRRAMRREHAAEQVRVREMELAILRSKSFADTNFYDRLQRADAFIFAARAGSRRCMIIWFVRDQALPFSKGLGASGLAGFAAGFAWYKSPLMRQKASRAARILTPSWMGGSSPTSAMMPAR